MRKGLVLSKHSGFRPLRRASAVENPADRSASRHQLQATLNNMALALSCVDEAIVWTDGDGRIQWCNAAFEQLVNRSALLEQPLTELLPLTLNGALLSLHPANSMAGQCGKGPYDFQRPDRKFTLAITVRPLPTETEASATNGVMLVIRDVTASLQPPQAEIACHDEQRFRQIFATTAVGTAITSLEGKFLQANAAYCQTLGYTEAELLTHTFQQITHPDDITYDLEYTRKLIAGEISCCHLEKRYLHKQGNIVWGLLSLAVVRDWQQRPLYCIAQMQNISDRKQAEADLRESETRLRLALEAASMSTWDWDIPTDTVVYAGSLGSDDNGPRGIQHQAYASFLNDVHSDDRAAVEQSLARALEGAAYNIEFRVNWADGTQHWIGSKGQAYFDEQGRSIRMLGVAKDITARKQVELALYQLNQELEQRVQNRTAQLEQSNRQLQAAIAAHQQTETALRTSEERFYTIFDHAPIAISLADAHTYRIVAVNQAHRDLLGYSNAELVTMTHVDITHPDDVNANLEQVKQLLDGTIPRFQIEKRFRRQNGIWLWTTLTVTLVRDPNGSTYSMGMIEDITDRKRREAERQRAEDALRLTQFSIDRSTDPIWWVQPDGTISYVNDAACRDLGYERDAIVGQRVTLFNPDFQPAGWSAHWQAMKEQGACTFETRHQTKNGIIYPVEITVNYIELNGNEYHCSTVRNITDRKRAEAQLLASLGEKEILLKEIHHRVKNNLQTVYSLLNLQANTIQDPHTLSLFKDSQHRVKVMALIHEKLYQSESLANINFADYVRHLVTDLIRSYSSNPAKIHVQIEVTELELAIDAVLPCGFIINELIANALKYAFPDDRSDDLQSTIQIGFAVAPPHHYRLVIADNGVGWSESTDLPLQAANLSTLGLQLVQAFVQQLRGTVSLDRTNGSRFEILFPNPT